MERRARSRCQGRWLRSWTSIETTSKPDATSSVTDTRTIILSLPVRRFASEPAHLRRSRRRVSSESQGNAHFAALSARHPCFAALRKRVPLEVVSKRIGHSDIRITLERYVSVYQERYAKQRFFLGWPGLEPTLGGSGQFRPIPKSAIL